MTRALLFPAVVLMSVSRIAAAQVEPRPDALLEELHVAHVSQVQEQGEIQLTLALSSQRTNDSPLRESIAGEFGVEIGVTDRLQLSLEGTVLEQSSFGGDGDAVEIGLAYELLRGSKANLIFAVDSHPRNPRELEMRVSSGLLLGRGEIHSGVAIEFEDDDRNVALEVAAIWPWADWRGTLEVHSSSASSSTVSIIPGVAWTRHGVQFGVGVELPSNDWSTPRLMFNTTLEF